MSERDEQIERLQAENVAEFMELGPGLRTSTRVWVVARDRERGRVLLGGLGAMGVGEMWFVDADRYVNYVGYDDAPEGDSRGGFGT